MEKKHKKVERLYDVAPVTFPAYSSTEVVARSLEAAKAEKIQAPEIEIREEIVEEITEDVQEPPIIEQPERTIKTAYRKRQIEILKLKNKNIALAA